MTTLERILGKNYKFEYGSASDSMLQASEEWVKDMVVEVLYHHLFDFELWNNGNLDNEERRSMKEKFDQNYTRHLLRDLNYSLDHYFVVDHENKIIKWVYK